MEWGYWDLFVCSYLSLVIIIQPHVSAVRGPAKLCRSNENVGDDCGDAVDLSSRERIDRLEAETSRRTEPEN